MGVRSATLTGVARLESLAMASVVVLVTAPVATLLLFGAAITPVDNKTVIPKTIGLINTDFQNADDIWLVLLTVRWMMFNLT